MPFGQLMAEFSNSPMGGGVYPLHYPINTPVIFQVVGCMGSASPKRATGWHGLLMIPPSRVLRMAEFQLVLDEIMLYYALLDCHVCHGGNRVCLGQVADLT